jgi:hypothetical protein
LSEEGKKYIKSTSVDSENEHVSGREKAKFAQQNQMHVLHRGSSVPSSEEHHSTKPDHTQALSKAHGHIASPVTTHASDSHHRHGHSRHVEHYPHLGQASLQGRRKSFDLSANLHRDMPVYFSPTTEAQTAVPRRNTLDKSAKICRDWTSRRQQGHTAARLESAAQNLEGSSNSVMSQRQDSSCTSPHGLSYNNGGEHHQESLVSDPNLTQSGVCVLTSNQHFDSDTNAQYECSHANSNDVLH